MAMRELIEKLEQHVAQEAGNVAIKAQRAMVMAELDALLRSSEKKVLVINSGLGEDALLWAEHGHRVCVIEPNLQKLNLCRLFSSYEKVQDRVEFRQAHAQWMQTSEFTGYFDVIYAGFGAMNKLPAEELQRWSYSANEMLKPGGKFISLVQPDYCPWERVHYFRQARWGLARRRSQGAALSVNEAGDVEATYFYSPEVFLAFFEDCFNLEYKTPIGVFTPPQSLGHHYPFSPKWMARLQRLENFANRWKSLSACCDYFLMVLGKPGTF